MIRGLYDRTLALAGSPRAPGWLYTISFMESSFFPIPPDVLLVPMSVAQRRKAFHFATFCTLASVAGGILGYAIGYYLYESVGMAVISFYGLEKGAMAYQEMFAEWGLWIILIKGLTPIPYKLVTIASGAASFDIVVFIIASVVTRGGRFFILATLIWYFGEPVRNFIEKRLQLVFWVLLISIILGFVSVEFLV